MFALARRMGYEMRPIARRSENAHQTPNSQRMSGQNYRVPLRQGRDYSKVKCFSCGQMGHTQAQCPKPDQSLPFRPDGWNLPPDGPRQRPDGPQQGNGIQTGTHPYRSARDSFGPQIIFIVHINQLFAIVSLTHRWPLCHRKFCSVRGSGCNSIDRRLLRSYY